jgi:hypothetical protein
VNNIGHQKNRHANLLDNKPARNFLARPPDTPNVMRGESMAPAQRRKEISDVVAHTVMLQV